MGEVILQWFYIVLASCNLTGDLPVEQELNWRGSTQSQTVAVEATSERHKRIDPFEGDIYNGF